MSERRDIQEAILKNWANLGYITSSRIDDQLFLDDETDGAYSDGHRRGMFHKRDATCPDRYFETSTRLPLNMKNKK